MSQLFFGLALAAVAAACAPQTARHTSMFRNQLDEDWKYWMVQYPEVATAIGYPGQNMRWTDYSRSAIDARAEHLMKSLQSFSTIDRAQLSAPLT